MNFSEYQQEALKTAMYPNIGSNILYPMLGLIGESGEISGKISKIIRDDGGTMTRERRASIKGELGDILWFMATVCAEAGLDMGNLYMLAERAVNNTHMTDLPRLAFKLSQQTAHMSMLVEQFVYGPNKGDMDVLAPLSTDITMLFTNMIDLCLACSLDIEQVAQSNLEKLASRKQRGVLQGSGDQR
ncbi:hypothetical protein LCGC14_1045970 [marine sediment metagenome]|uniref:Uncharacterized protein n=1 Tax=marine sediment metagenome TaxID=412755 RepID=A0A0F9NC33_9ZZZZ